MATGLSGGSMGAAPTYYNGTGYDQALNNIQAVLVPVGARTVAPAIATQANLNHKGVLLYLNVTAFTTALSLTLALQAIEPVSGTATVNLLTGAAVTATGLYTYAYYPGLPNTAAALGGLTLAQNGILPRVWTAAITPGNSNSVTYSLSYALAL